MLRIHLLGTPQVFLDEEPVQIQRKLQRALLYYLACQEAPVSRSELVDLFWPGESIDLIDKRRHLREALSKLRLELPDKDYLITENEAVALDSRRVWVDIKALRSIMQRIWQQIHFISLETPLPAAIANELSNAVNLWHGERFLAGANLPESIPLDDWLSGMTRDMDYARQQVLERLAYHLAALGDFEPAIYLLRQVLKSEELDERLHLQVLIWMQTAGKHTDMVAYCQALKKLYSRESGGPFPPSLERFCEKVNKPRAPTPGSRVPGLPASEPYVPYAGREDLLKALKLHYQRGGGAVILGETGAGKTRLVHQLATTLQPEPRLLQVEARSAEQNLPFQPVIDILRSSITQEEWLELPKAWAVSFAWILPELLTLRPEINLPASTTEETRSKIFEALHQLLKQITQSRRVLIFVDNAQWCDEATLAVLAYLLNHHFFKKHGFLILAASSEGMSSELQDFLNLAENQLHLVQYPLPGLQTGDVYELARFFLGQSPSDLLVNRLLRDTGGNPLFLIETLRALLDSVPNLASTTAVDELPLPGSISNLLKARLDGLTSQCRGTLETAAVIGYSFTPELLELVLGASPEAVAANLDELQSRNLIQPDERMESKYGYVFVHDVFREVLLRGLTPARRRLLHLHVAQGLEAQPASQVESSSAVLASHYEAAGNEQRACQYRITAAEYALRRFSPAEAVAAYHQAESLIRQNSSTADVDCILKVYCGLADLAYEVGDMQGVLNAYTVLQHYGEQRSSPLLLGSAHSGRALLFYLKSDLYTAQIETELAVRYLDMAGNLHETMKAHIRRGMIWQAMFRLKEAGEEYEKAVELEHGHFEPGLIKTAAAALDQLAILHHMAGWPEKAIEQCEHSLRHYRVLGHRGGNMLTNSILALQYHQIGAYSRTLEVCHQEFELARQHGRWRSGGMLHLAAGRTLLLMGQLDEAWKNILYMEEYSRRFGSMDLLGDSHGFRGYFFMATDSLPEAVAAFRASIEQAGMNEYQTVFAKFYLGFCLGQLGDLHTGLSMLEQSIQFAEHNDLGRILVPARLYRAVLTMMLGNHAVARTELNWVLEEARRRKMATMVHSSLLRLGDLDLKEGQVGAAAEKAAAVIATAFQQGDRLHELSGLNLAIRVEQLRGCPVSNRGARVREILAEIELGSHLEAVRPYFKRIESYYLSSLPQV